MNLSLDSTNNTVVISGINDLVRINSWIAYYILNPILAYFLPIAVTLTIVNNSLVITIFLFSKDVSRRITPSIRVYYMITAIADILVCLPMHLTSFLGKSFLIGVRKKYCQQKIVSYNIVM